MQRNMNRRDSSNPFRNLAGWMAIAGLVLTGSAKAGAVTQPAAVQVAIDNFDFSPMMLTITTGTTVTWTNHDDVPHTVVSADDPRAFKSPPLDTDDAYSFTFVKAGTYKYFCTVHPKMVGVVTVKNK